MSTLRSLINAKKKKITWVAIASWLTFAACLVLSARFPQTFPLIFVAFTGFIVSILFLMFGIRCAKCGGNLGYTISTPSSSFFSISDKIRFCPYCGVRLDTEA